MRKQKGDNLSQLMTRFLTGDRLLCCPTFGIHRHIWKRALCWEVVICLSVAIW